MAGAGGRDRARCRGRCSHRGAVPVPGLHSAALSGVDTSRLVMMKVAWMPAAGPIRGSAGAADRGAGCGAAGTAGRPRPGPGPAGPGGSAACVRGPPVRAVLRRRGPGAVHVNGVVPPVRRSGQQRHSARSAWRRSRTRCARRARRGDLPRSSCVGARRDRARSPCRGGQGSEGAASRSGALTRGSSVPSPRSRPARSRSRPGRHAGAADPPPLMVVRPAALLAAVDLHVSGVQVDRDRPGGQRRARSAGSSDSIRPVATARPDSTACHRPGPIRPARPPRSWTPARAPR